MLSIQIDVEKLTLSCKGPILPLQWPSAFLSALKVFCIKHSWTTISLEHSSDELQLVHEHRLLFQG